MFGRLLSDVIRQFGLSCHIFADDSQLHDSIAAPDLPRLASAMSVCIENVSDWMKTNKLKMNDDKTEVIRI